MKRERRVCGKDGTISLREATPPVSAKKQARPTNVNILPFPIKRGTSFHFGRLTSQRIKRQVAAGSISSFLSSSRFYWLPVLVVDSDDFDSEGTGAARQKDRLNARQEVINPAPHSGDARQLTEKVKNAVEHSRYVYGPLVLDAARHEVYDHGQEVELTPKEFRLLEYFLRHPGYIRTREILLNAVWGHDYYGTTRTVDVHIRRIKKKIPLLTSAIISVYSLGYKLRNSNSS